MRFELNPRVVNMTDSFEAMKVPQLKEELTKRGLSTKGLKKDLVARLAEAVGPAVAVEQETADAVAAAAVNEALLAAGIDEVG